MPRRMAVLAIAASVALAVIVAPVAFGQSGGIGSPGGTTTDPSTTTTPSSGTGQVFPLPGAHTFGQGFGAPRGRGRGHQGQDIMAACGAPEVAVSRSKVVFIGFQ